MKTNFYKVAILLFAVSMSLMSCNSDERNAEKIVGTWTCVSSYDHEWETWQTYSQSSWNKESSDDYKSAVVVFKEDGTVETPSYSYGLFHEYIGKGEKDRNTYDWSILDDTLYIESFYSWYIETLTNNKLVISIEYEKTGPVYNYTVEGSDICTQGEKHTREFKRL